MRACLPLPIVLPLAIVGIGSIAKIDFINDWELILIMSAVLGALPYSPIAYTLWHLSRDATEGELRRAALLAPPAMALLLCIPSGVLMMNFRSLLFLAACGLAFGYAYVLLGFLLLACGRCAGIVRPDGAR